MPIHRFDLRLKYNTHDIEWTAGCNITFDPDRANQTIVELAFPLSFPAGQSELTDDLVIYYCEVEALSLCLIERAPLTIASGGADAMILRHTIELPEGQRTKIDNPSQIVWPTLCHILKLPNC